MKILFVCEYNACRSQMAEGIARHLLPKHYTIHSAGIYPGKVNQHTIDVMKEIGIDISSHQSKRLESISQEEYDAIVVLAEPAEKLTQTIKARKRFPWFHPDPATNEEKRSDDDMKSGIRKVRDAIKKQIEDFIKTL